MTEQKQEQELDNLWVELTKSPRPHEVVPLPRHKDGTKEPVGYVHMVLLTAEENMIIKKEAENKLKELFKNETPNKTDRALGYDSLYNDFVSMGILFRSCKRQDCKTPFFPNKEQISKVFTIDELSILLNHYYSMMYKYGMVMHEMTEEEMSSWLQQILNSTQVDPIFLLNSFSSEMLKTFTLFLVDQLKSLPMEKLCCGEQQENTY